MSCESRSGEFDCRDVYQLAYEYLDESIPAERRDKLEIHLSHCLHCKSVTDLQQKVCQLVREDCGASAPPALKARILARLRAEGSPCGEGKAVASIPHGREWSSDVDGAQARREMGFPGDRLPAE